MESGPDAAVMRIIVAVDGPDDLHVVDHAVGLARERHARLELVGGTPRLWAASVYAIDCVRLERELREYAAALLREAVDRVAPDVCVTMRQVHGRAADHLLGRHEDRPGDLLLLRGGHRRITRPRRRRRRTATLLRVPVVVQDGVHAVRRPA